jgi:hypothetical protein
LIERTAIFHRDVPALDKTGFAKTLPERRYEAPNPQASWVLTSPITGMAGCCPHARFTFTASSREPPPIRAMNSRRLLNRMAAPATG